MSTYIAGLDEAGRGSLLGPLVIGCVIIDDINKLEGIGIKDSKMLDKNKRLILYNKIKQVANEVIVRNITPQLLDEYNINDLEMNTVADILKCNKVDEVYIDSFDVNPKRLEDRLMAKLNYDINIYASHKADADNILVGAASIIAKVNRDNVIDKLTIHGNIGSGYPSDNTTIEFVKGWYYKYKSYPPFVRKKWSTLKHIATEQKSIDSYIN